MPGEATAINAKPARIGEILEQCGLVNREQLDAGLAFAQQYRVRLGEALIQLGFLNEDKLTWALGVQFDLSYVDLEDGMIDWEFLTRLPLDDLERILFLPLVSIGETVHAVIADPTVPGKNELLQQLFPDQRVIVQLASAREIREVIQQARKRVRRAPARGDALTRIEGWLEDIRAGRVEGLLALPSPHAPGLADLLVLGKEEETPRISQAEIESLGDPFAFLSDRPTSGILPMGYAASRRAVRWFAWPTLRGFALGLQAIPKVPPAKGSPRIVVVSSADPVGVKHRILEGMAKDPAVKTIGLESYIEAEAPGSVQSQIPYNSERITLLIHLSNFSSRLRILIEEDQSSDVLQSFTSNLPLALASRRIVVVLRTPAASPESIEFFEDHKQSIDSIFIPGPDDLTSETLKSMIKGENR